MIYTGKQQWWLGVVLLVLSASCRNTAPKSSAESATSGGERVNAPANAKSSSTEIKPLSANALLGITKTEQCRYHAPVALPHEVQTRVTQGVEAMRKDSLQEARARFESATAADAGAYPAWFHLGLIAVREGDARKAGEYFERALGARNDYALAWRAWLAIFVSPETNRDRKQRLQKAAKEYPTNLDLQAIYVEELAKDKDFDRGWKAARAGLSCDERHLGLLKALIHLSWAQKRDQLAAAILDQAQAIDPNDAELFLLRAQQLSRESERSQDVINALEQAIKANPDYVEARTQLGIRYLNAGNYPQALEELSAAARLLPIQAAVFLNLGEAYRANQRWSEAQDAYEKALSMDGSLAAAHLGLGLTWMSSANPASPEAEISNLQKAAQELKTYRDAKGAKLSKSDPTEYYLTNIQRRLDRAQRAQAKQKREPEQPSNSPATK